jgi:hypothetical protein
MYRYRESFVAMIDRVHATYPNVTFQIDETNDYRMWPFESAVRGPSWFLNGSSDPTDLLHTLWLTAPYVPSHSLGQSTLEGGSLTTYGVDYMMAMSMLSHMTFWRDLTKPALTADQIARIKFWTDLYKAHRDELGRTVVYPLLGDPAAGTTWSVLQPWNPDTQRGYVFAFRQNTADPSVTLQLRGIRAGESYTVKDLVTGASLGTVTGTQLRTGYVVSAPAAYSARVLQIVPVP